MKDELGGKILSQFVGLQAKSYSTLTQRDNQNAIINKKATKGVLRSIVRKKLRHRHMLDIFEKQLCLVTTSKCIRTKNRKILTTEIRKSALNAFDYKRFIMSNGVETLSWGHYKIKTLTKNKVE